MTTPPPPPPDPHQPAVGPAPPEGGQVPAPPGVFGPPATGGGSDTPWGGSTAPGYGAPVPPAPGAPPGYGPGYGPAYPSPPGPVPPPPGGGRGGAVLAGVVAAALIAAVVVGGVLLLGEGDDGDAVAGEPSATPTPEVSETPSEPPELPEEEPPAEEPEGEPEEDTPEPDDGAGGGTGLPFPPSLLQAGDCYDRSEKQGRVHKRPCDSPHEAEVVSSRSISGSFAGDKAVERRAETMCRGPLRRKAAKQPPGTVGGQLVSFPSAEGVRSGIARVTCSLTADDGKKLRKPLA
ncbi:hypothetical protein E0L36_16395 [Streptomyces sp. AJS327]|uniref:hypothetical protein n=1 Tax=Streptomyces sp. AJS327 TaxID=2545265 RepID=UPI0015DDC8A5|nr:hypothetical protein [Streptomyces sp. AJS327]MBA0052434.1 hypothetical protein [Streptomyces sp. AJS327]